MASKPNLLLIMADQLRADALGCTGGWVQTPNLDRLAREGVRFRNCVTTTPVCVPARLSLATGLYAHNTGVWNNMERDMAADTPTWMQAVRAAGYRTSLFGKTHLHRHHGDLREREDLMRAYGLDDIDEIGGPRASTRVMSHMTALWEKRGYLEAYREDYRDRFANCPQIDRPSPLPLELYADVYVGQSAKSYLKAYARPEPWCCWVSFGGPHEPWDAPDEYTQRYRAAEMPAPRSLPKETGARPEGHLDQLAREHHQKFKLTSEQILALRRNYAGNVTLIDEQIGQILQTIEARGELENTLIVFTSDHGEMNSDCGMLYKSNFMDAAVRVPFIVKAPHTLSVKHAGKVCSAPVEWIDVGATLVDFAGGTYRHRQFARSVRTLLEDPTQRLRSEALSEIHNEVMLLDEQWKIALNEQGQVYLLFDLENDPDERINRAGNPVYRAQSDRLRLRILERLLSTQQDYSRHA
jgi:choline-sulfatase